MRRLTYENSRGESIVFYLSPLLITSLSGIGEVEADLQSQKSPYQDGVNHIDTLLQPRYPELEGVILETDLTDIKQYREQILRVCNPKLGVGKLTLELDGDLKVNYGVLDGTPSFPDKGKSPNQTFLITWKCPNPYWLSPSIESEPTFEALFSFPFSGSFEMGVQRDRRIINNDGDAEAPIEIEFHGPATNPKITNNTTGEYIKVNQALGENEVMKIDTTPGEKSVYFVQEDGTEVNVFNWIDLDSTFFQLQLGENEIQYTADNNIQDAEVNMYYQKRYVGV